MSTPVPHVAPIPAGSITLTDARTGSTRAVVLREFAMARSPVTWAQYSAVLGSAVPREENPDAPVHSVSWFDAVAWCNVASEAAGLAPTASPARSLWA